MISAAGITRDSDNFFRAVITRVVKGSIVNVTVNLPLELTCLMPSCSFEEMKLTIGIGQWGCLTIPPATVYLFQG